MKTSIENQIAVAKWQRTSKKMAKDLGLSEDEIQKFMPLFLKAYEIGQTDLMDTMREIYNDDPCELDELFHLESGHRDEDSEEEE